MRKLGPVLYAVAWLVICGFGKSRAASLTVAGGGRKLRLSGSSEAVSFDEEGNSKEAVAGSGRVAPAVAPSSYSQLEGQPKENFKFEWDEAGCTMGIPLSHGQARTQFSGMVSRPVQGPLTPVNTNGSVPLSGGLEVSFPEDCPNNFVGLIDRMKQGKFTTESENVGVVHPTIKSTIKSDTGEPLGVILSEMKVHFQTTAPIFLHNGEFGIAFRIEMVTGVLLVKNSTFTYLADLGGMVTNGASSGSIKPSGQDVMLEIPNLPYTFDTAQKLGSQVPVRLILTFISNITAEFEFDYGSIDSVEQALLPNAGGQTADTQGRTPPNRQGSLPAFPTPYPQSNSQGGVSPPYGHVPQSALARARAEAQAQQSRQAQQSDQSTQQGDSSVMVSTVPASQFPLGGGPISLGGLQVIPKSDETNVSMADGAGGNLIAGPNGSMFDGTSGSSIGAPNRAQTTMVLTKDPNLLPAAILSIPIILSLLLTLGMAITGAMYLLEEQCLKYDFPGEACTVSSDQDDLDDHDLEFNAGKDETLWTTGDFNAIRGIHPSNHFLDTEFSMATIASSRGVSKDFVDGVPVTVTHDAAVASLACPHPTLKSMISRDGKNGLSYEDLYCAVPAKGLLWPRQRQFKKSLEWDALDRCSMIEVDNKSFRIIMHPTSGRAHYGELTGIVGPEGAGKTTLLNMISGRVKGFPRKSVIRGSVSKEHFPGSRSADFLLAHIGQDPQLDSSMTVEELLIRNAILSRSRESISQDLRQRIGNIVEMLDLGSVLYKKLWKNSLSISALQKKKVLIARELVRKPDALVLDDPVSGLDTRDTLELISSCRKLAKSGLMVLVATRHPTSEAFNMFDRLMLLSRGRPIYHGLGEELSAFFSKVGCPCPVEMPISQHAHRVASKPSSLIQVLTSEKNPLRMSDLQKLVDIIANGSSTRIRRNLTIELGRLHRSTVEPQESLGDATSFSLCGNAALSEENQEEGNEEWRDEPDVTLNMSYSGNQEFSPVIPTAGDVLPRGTVSPLTPGRIALETAILEDSVGQVSMPVSARPKRSARVWARPSNAWCDGDPGGSKSEASLDIFNTAGSEFGDSVLEFDLISNPPTWRSGATPLPKSREASGFFTGRESLVPNSVDESTDLQEPLETDRLVTPRPHPTLPLSHVRKASADMESARSELLYRRATNPFDSDSDTESKSNTPEIGGIFGNLAPVPGDRDRVTSLYNSKANHSSIQGQNSSVGNQVFGGDPLDSESMDQNREELLMDYSFGAYETTNLSRDLFMSPSPNPSSPLSLSPRGSYLVEAERLDTVGPFSDADKSPGQSNGSSKKISQQGTAETEGDVEQGCTIESMQGHQRLVPQKSRIPRAASSVGHKSTEQPGISRIAKPQVTLNHDNVDDIVLPPNPASNSRPLVRVPSLNLSCVANLSNQGRAMHVKASVPAQNSNQGPFDTGPTPRTDRSMSGIIQPLPRGENLNRPLPSHRDLPYRFQPGTGVVSPGHSFDLFPMEWQNMNSSRKHNGGGGMSTPLTDRSEGTPEKIGNLDTSRSMAAYAQEVAGYAQEAIARRETEMSMTAVVQAESLTKSSYENTLRNQKWAPFYVEAASMFVASARDLLRRKAMLPLHIASAVVIGLGVGLMFFNMERDEQGQSHQVSIIFSLLCLLTVATLALFKRMHREDRAIKADFQCGRYRAGSVLLVRAGIENLLLRILPVLIFSAFFVPLSGVQVEVAKFLLFASGLSVFWISLSAALYAIFMVVPLPVGVYVMAMQLCLHGPLLCGFFFSKDKLWSIAQFITNLSTFCNVFEILAVAELRDDGGKIVEKIESSTRHAYPSEMGLNENGITEDALISVGIYFGILVALGGAMAIRVRRGCRM